MLLMYYPSIRGEELPYYAKKAIWKIFREYIDSQSERMIDKCPGDVVQAILRFQY